MKRNAFFAGHSETRNANGMSRRDALKAAALGVGGLTAGGMSISAAEAEAITMRIGSDSPLNAPHTLSAVRLKEHVEKHTGGRIKVQIFPNSQLGDSQAMTTSVKSGTLDGVLTNDSNASVSVPGAAVFDLPFLFKDTLQTLRAANGELGDTLKPKIEAAFNCEVIGWTTDGARNFWDNKHPIRTPEDLKGLKLRLSSGSKILRDTYLAFGAIPTPLAFSETYTGLESGVINGSDMGVNDLIQFKIYQVAKYLTLTRHVSPVNLFIVSKSFMNRLSPDDRRIIREAGKLGAAAQVKAVLSGEGAALNQLKMKGMHVSELEDRNAFVAKVQPVLVNATAQVGADIMKLARAAAAS